jgi:transcription-repair coupling factor (superfamily II helicase)
LTRSVIPESCSFGEEQGTHSKFSIPNSQFSPGDVVVHKKFGIGTVKDFADMGDDSIVTVAFNSGLNKSLMTKYAKLMKI